MSETIGFRFFSTGQQWENAFHRAIQFCEEGNGFILLGPGIGLSGEAWIQEKLLEKNSLLFGNRILPWREYVKNRARVARLSAGQGFKTFQQASLRAFTKNLLETLDQSGAFTHISGIWKEDRFFDGFLKCLEEARLAGFTNPETIDRAFDRLKKSDDSIYRDVYQDFRFSLIMYEAAIQSKEDTFDYPRMLQTAIHSKEEETEIFCLGFDSFSMLEVDLLQFLAQRTRVTIPLTLEDSRVHELSKQKSEPQNKTEASFFALLNGFSSQWEWQIEEKQTPLPASKSPVIFEAHSPLAEKETVARWTEEQLSLGKMVRIVTRRGSDLPKHLRTGKMAVPRTILSHALAQTFFHCLEIKTKDFPIGLVVELSWFLHSANGKYAEIPEFASKRGIRKGLDEWKRIEKKDPEIESFVEILDRISTIFPARGTTKAFQEALADFVAVLQLGEMAQRSYLMGTDSEVHGVIAAVLRFSQMLSASVEGELTLEEWCKELQLLMKNSPLGEEKAYSSLEIYSYGEWIPPSKQNQVCLAAEFLSDVVPSRSFQFFLEENARRRLSEFLITSQIWDEDAFFQYVKKLFGFSTLFSRPKLGSAGKEVTPPAAVALCAFQSTNWPAVNLENPVPYIPAVAQVKIDLKEEKRLSASFFEQYKECPFKAFALKVLKLEDSAKAPSLDVGPMDLGSLSHRILELFYGTYNGKSGGLEELEKNLDLSIEQAAKETSPRYFKGGSFLWNAQLLRLRGQLVDFLRSDLEFYSNFPSLQGAEFERKMSGEVGGIPWSGKADRVDYDPLQKRFLVSDYKSGSTLPATKDIESLELFQIPLYINALEKETGMEPIGGLYVSLKSGKRNQGLVKKRFNKTKKSEELKDPTYFELHQRSGCLKEEDVFSRIISESLGEMQKLGKEIQNGEFPVQPLHEESCKKCEVRPACRIRELEGPQKKFTGKPVSFVSFTEKSLFQEEAKKKEKRFNDEQRKALESKDQFVFIEASAGTGKTTVIVEKVHQFLLEKRNSGLSAPKAAERFLGISFTEKSTEELGLRLSRSLSDAGETKLAILAQHQISTIHGFCKRVISEFPLESKISPMAELMSEREKEIFLEEALEVFFTEPNEGRRNVLNFLFPYFDRRRIEKLLRVFTEKRLLWRQEIEKFVSGYGNFKIESEVTLNPEKKLEDQVLFHFIQLSDDFSQLYASLKSSNQKMDFNDLEAGALSALSVESVSNYFRKKLDLVLVDEFQDTNSVQREILEKIARKNWQNFFVVGDAKQSIYRFRAADVSVFQGLRSKAAESGALVNLFRNYRSRKELVEASNTISAHLFPKEGEGKSFEALFSESAAGRDSGGESEILHYDLEEKTPASERRQIESRLVAKKLKQEIAMGAKPKEIAVLLRKISGNESFLKALMEENIPFRVGSSKGFYSQPIILDAIALLRSLYFPFHSLAVFSLLRSPFVKADDQWIYEKVLRLTHQKKENGLFSLVEERQPRLRELRQKITFQTLSETLQEAFRWYPYDQRDAFQLEKLYAVIDSLEGEFPKLEIIERISQWAGWESESDAEDDSTMPEPSSDGAISVMTIHSSKGLEFDLTVLPDLMNTQPTDSLPLRVIPGKGMALELEDTENPEFNELKVLEKEMEVAEAKRLFYVAFTRAKEKNIYVFPKLEGKLSERWVDYLRKVELRSQGKAEWPQKKEMKEEALVTWSSRVEEIFPRFTTNISEIAANQFCSEFHRRKFVAKWDDLVVGLMPKPVDYLKKPKKFQSAPSLASTYLKKLKLENKERGIALHRVLERVGFEQEDRALWLRESYVNQGADPNDNLLESLIQEDLKVLDRFLSSSSAKKFFDSNDQAFPELSFRWRWKEVALFGTIDRLVKRKNGEWLVVDYKSSLLEDSLDRYRFQVESYMCAVRVHALSLGEQDPKITGYLVNLSDSSVVDVGFDPKKSIENLEKEILRVRENHRIQGNVFDLHGRGIRAEEHCFSCPYSLHCDLGTKFVLAFQ